MAHVALTDDAALGVVLRHAVRTVPGAVLATDTGVGAVLDDAGERILRIGVDRAALEARRLEAVIAPHRQERAGRGREEPAFELADTPPVDRRGIAVLLVAGDDAALAADALPHVEVEAVLLAGLGGTVRHPLGCAIVMVVRGGRAPPRPRRDVRDRPRFLLRSKEQGQGAFATHSWRGPDQPVVAVLQRWRHKSHCAAELRPHPPLLPAADYCAACRRAAARHASGSISETRRGVARGCCRVSPQARSGDSSLARLVRGDSQEPARIVRSLRRGSSCAPNYRARGWRPPSRGTARGMRRRYTGGARGTRGGMPTGMFVKSLKSTNLKQSSKSP